MPDYGLGSWPMRRARIDSAGLALRQGDRSRSYGELADRVEHLARAFVSLGVGYGDRVAYLGLNDLATFEAFFAATRIGALFVPLNTRLTAAEIAYLLGDSQPSVLLYGPEHAEVVTAADPTAHGVRTVLPISDPAQRYEGLIESATALPAVGSEVSLSDDALILYTSGTTGQPKGAVLTHENLTFNTMNQLAHADVLSSDVALCICPLFHATGLGQVTLPTLFKGGTVVVVPKFDAEQVLAAVDQLRINSFAAVPTMLQMLCEHPNFATTNLSSLRFAIYGGSMVIERVARAWQQRGVSILQGYGMTEASPGVYMAPEAGAREHPVSIGSPHFFTDVSLDAPGVDDSGQRPAEPGAMGELLVRGPNVFRGYWNRPADTELAFTNGWFRSGDVLRIGDDGWAYVVDRVKDMIISGGENVYPAEVESAITALPGVLDCAVVAEKDERWGEVGHAFVILAVGAAASTEGGPIAWTQSSMRERLRDTLASFKIPRLIEFVDELPRTATGKVRKQLLRNRISPAPGSPGPALTDLATSDLAVSDSAPSKEIQT
ncbi:MAG TPA: long-chain fatty acid--CoA ligase [Kineosporiaceae bacterium]|nr:long-chain fatty acid--CoA ligase [Kineosporiaceae bacterium]